MVKKENNDKTNSTPSSFPIPWFIIDIFLVVVVGILILGLLFFAKQKENIRNEAAKNLYTIAKLKVDQITHWRKERLNNAELIFNNRQFINQVNQFLNNPKQAEIREDLQKYLHVIKENSECSSILLIDSKGILQLSIPETTEKAGSHAEKLFTEAIKARKVIISDFHTSETVPYVHIDLVIPLYLPKKGNDIFIAQLLLRLDPNISLYPLIQTWPTPSRTSETLLIRQEGDSIVYLNELRHIKQTALRLKLPISRSNLPPAMTVKGHEEIIEGIDYRNVPVMAVARKIPNTNWYIVSKTDLEEVYSALHRQAWTAGIGILLLIIAVSSITGLWIRNQHVKFYKTKYLDELERQAILKHIDYAIKYANDAILLMNKNGKIIEANDKACELYGYAKDEFLQLNIDDLHIEILNNKINKLKELFEREEGLVFEARHIKKDKTLFYVEVSSRVIKIKGTVFLQAIIRDVTERKEIEKILRENEYRFKAHIENTPLAFLEFDTNQQIIKWNPSAERIFGYTEEEILGKHINIIIPERYQQEVEYVVKELFENKTPNSHTNENITKDGRIITCEWHNTPILDEKGNAIAIASIAQDITEAKENERKVLLANERLEYLLSASSAVIYTLTTDENYSFTFISKNSELLLGYSPEDILENPHFWIDRIHPDDVMRVLDELDDLCEKKNIIQQYRFKHKNGNYIWLRDEKKITFNQQGNPAEIVGLLLNITDQKLAEEELILSEQTAYALLNAPKEVSYLLNLERKVITINEAGATLFKKMSNDLIGRCIDELLPPEIAKARAQIFEKIIRSPQIIHFEDEFDGKYWENSFYPIYNIHGMVSQIAVFSRDVTEKRKAEEAIRQLAETLNAIVESAPLPIYMLDTEGRVQKIWNPAAEKILGWKKEEVLGKPLANLVVQENKKDEFTDLFNNLLSGIPLNGIDVVRQRKDGTRTEYSIFANPLHSKSGDIIGFIVMLADLTERKKAEEALKRSEELFRSLVETSPIAIAVYSGLHKNLQFVNSKFTQLFGYTEEDIKNIDDWWQIAYPSREYREMIKTKWLDISEKECLNKGEIETIESVVTCKNGNTKYVNITTCTIGEQSYMFFIDFTEYKLAEQALQQANRFNELLIETIPYGIDIVDEEGKILFMSKAMKALAGYDATGSYCWEIYKDDRQKCQGCKIGKSISFSKPESIETQGIFGGKIYQISQIGILYEGRKAILEIFQDITEQKRLEQEIMQSEKLMSIGTMAGGIAHDFNNVLAIILGYSSILQVIKDNNEKFAESVNAIRSAVDRGANLVRQILTFARKTDVSFQPLSLPDTVKELVSMLQQTFPKIITFNTIIHKPIPYINADQTQIHQALLNLCVNARDAMPNGGEITIEVSTIERQIIKDRFASADNKCYVCVSVSDTGVGMDENILKHIFDPFFTTKEKGKGTGLGLSVVYGIVQAHKGFIDVESQVGKGTTFRLYFPVPEESTEILGMSEKKEAQIVGGNETILVVEDEALLLELLKILLESNGYKILTATDGEEAIQIYSQHANQIDLVLTDYGLPKLTGTAVFEKFRQINPNVKVIFASGYFEPEIRTELENAGARAFLQKPYVTEEVLLKVRRVLDEK